MDKDTAKKSLSLVSEQIEKFAALDGRTADGRLVPGLRKAYLLLKGFLDSIDVNQPGYKPSRFVSSDSKESVRGLFRTFLSLDKRQDQVIISMSRADADRYMRALSDVMYFIDSSGT